MARSETAFKDKWQKSRSEIKLALFKKMVNQSRYINVYTLTDSDL